MFSGILAHVSGVRQVRDFQYSLLDHHFAKFMAERCRLPKEHIPHFKGLVQDLSAALTAGHSCLGVNREEAELLMGSPQVSSSEDTPLILFDNQLYLNRYYQYERRLAKRMEEMSKVVHQVNDCDRLLDDSFGGAEGDEVDLQRLSAEVTLKRSLSIISGGPGTGKTSTVAKIIALLLTVYGTDQKIALAAPTGKAAMRLRQSMDVNRKSHLPGDMQIHIPTEAMTLHRLLGVKNYSPAFRHHRQNPLDYDVVIVDEASMVDLALMSKLVDALKPDARLILLGDKDQLASVESGSVLNDLIGCLPENTTTLVKSYRFDTTIQQFARQINGGDAEAAWSVLNSDEYTNVSLRSTSSIDSIGRRYEKYMARAVALKDGGKSGGLVDDFHGFQVLCAVRKGELGVETINKKIERYLSAKGYECMCGEFYPGRPVMVTRNDYILKLYNGDIGFTLVDPDGKVKVWFERSNGSMAGFSPHRLPQCETVFAMSIHKSQGSEFDDVLVILPRQENRVLSRELIYTAVTRAKKRVEIMAEKEIFQLSIKRRVERYSGLRKMLEQ